MYNYLEAIKADVKEAIENNYDVSGYTREELEEKLNDDLWVDDSVTGNASGSYTFNTAQAKEYVLDNLDLLKEAAEELCCTGRAEEWLFDEQWEDADMTIRCWLLSRAISDALDDYDFEEQEV